MSDSLSNAGVNRQAQIQQIHAPFIHAMVKACQNDEEKKAFSLQINTLKQQGWPDLAKVCEQILAGERGDQLLSGLDEEDTAIVSGILAGIQNPTTLPKLDAQADGSAAAPGLASIIHAAASGDTGALHALSVMAEQMSQTGGAMAEIASVLRRLVNGERDLDQLSEKMGANSESLLVAIVNELGKLDAH